METTIARHRTEFQVVLLFLGGIQFMNGVWATVSPSGFYGDFPLGWGWVAALPAYNEHLMRDVGGLFLATGFILLAAAWFMERRLTILALVSYLLFAIPHTIYHYLNLEPYGNRDAIANVIILGATVVLPLWLLFRLSRESGPMPSGGAAPGEGAARIGGVPEASRNPLVRMAYRASRRRAGRVMAPVRIFAHHPRVLIGYGAHELAAEGSHRVPERIKHLAELRAAMVPGCEWCCDFGSSVSREKGVTEEDLRELPAYTESRQFSELEKLVLDYATGMSRSPVDVSDELFARLREHFDEGQLVELTDIIALENYRARFNWAFGIQPEGFSEGGFCLRPEKGAEAIST